MIIVLSLAVLTMACVVYHFVRRDWNEAIGVWLSIVVLIMSLITLGVDRVAIRGDIKEYYALEKTLAVARANPNISPYELAAIQTKVIETNEWLAKVQYYATIPLTNWFVPQDVMKLRPIE